MKPHHADLIVMATHGMTGWRQLPFGSVSEKVVRYATVLVLVLRVQPETKAGDASAKPDPAAATR